MYTIYRQQIKKNQRTRKKKINANARKKIENRKRSKKRIIIYECIFIVRKPKQRQFDNINIEISDNIVKFNCIEFPSKH